MFKDFHLWVYLMESQNNVGGYMTNVLARLLTLPFRRFHRVPWKPFVTGDNHKA